MFWMVGPAQAGEMIVKIGTAGPLTGNQAKLGTDSRNGVMFAVDELNARGMTIGGNKVKFVVQAEDDQADPKLSTAVAQRLVDDKQVMAIIGHNNSSATIPAGKIYDEAGILFITPNASNPTVSQQGFKNFYRIMCTDPIQAAKAATFTVKTLKAKTVVVVDDKTQYGQGLTDMYSKQVEQAGVKVLAREHISDKDSEFGALITAIKAKKPDVFYFGGVYSQAALLKKEAVKQGMKIPFIGGDSVFEPDYMKLGGNVTEGDYATALGMNTAKLPKYAEFAAKFNAKYGEIGYVVPYSYDATMVAAAAIQKAGSLDRKKITAAKKAIASHEGITGKVVWDEFGDNSNPVVSLYQVKNGKWVFVE
jgi:branched-chain amino acid transport system substrate-binding protein